MPGIVKGSDFDWQARRVLVTGASGFKGSWLCAILAELGAEVYGTVRNKIHPDSPYELLSLHDKIVEASADISDRQQILDLINSVEPCVIFHLAAKAIVPVSLRDPRRAFEVNIMGTINILEACRSLRTRNRSVCERILVCSTDHVFGDLHKPEDIPVPESRAVSYSGPYDTSKAAMELAVRSYHRNYREELPRICITRCANVFGFADTAPRRIIPEFVQAGIAKGTIPYRTGMNGRQFIHVADAASGYIMAASKLGDIDDKCGVPTFHFSIEAYQGTEDPRFVRVHELADLIAKETGATAVHENKDKLAPSENPILALNCQETREQLGWVPHKEFVGSLKELATRWYDHKTATAPGKRKAFIAEAVASAAGLLVS